MNIAVFHAGYFIRIREISAEPQFRTLAGLIEISEANAQITSPLVVSSKAKPDFRYSVGSNSCNIITFFDAIATLQPTGLIFTAQAFMRPNSQSRHVPEAGKEKIMRATFLNLESDFPIQNLQELIAWAISYQAQTHA